MSNPTTLALSGYETTKRLVAQRYKRAGKHVYVIALPIQLIPTHLPKPDPDAGAPDNREVKLYHARGFAQYWRTQEDWVAPPLLLDTMYPLSHDFEVTALVPGSAEFGVVGLPHNSSAEFQILDGQHRILGWNIALNDLADELRSTREALALARRNEDQDAMALWEAKLEKLDAQAKRAANEHITIEVWEGMTSAEHRQAFDDIARNALGIPKSVTVRFDTRRMFNRIAQTLMDDNAYLRDRIDPEAVRPAGKSPYFISAKALVDITHSAVLGVKGRWTDRKEKEFDENKVGRVVDRFFEVLFESFDDLMKVHEGEITMQDLRKHSLLGSQTILRALASTFNHIAVKEDASGAPYVTEASIAAVREFFEQLSGEMRLPISVGWFETGVFPEQTSSAPGSRVQELRALAERINFWADHGVYAVPPEPEDESGK